MIEKIMIEVETTVESELSEAELEELAGAFSSALSIAPVMSTKVKTWKTTGMRIYR